ncbi:MAG: carboxypeptidase-like regulatory domain-containing protein [Candidatus Limnocylindria bacterium]
MISHRLFVASATLALVAVACSPPPQSTPAPVAVTLSGAATAGPTCPVESQPPDPACAPRPVDGARILVIDAEGAQVAEGMTDGRGLFSIEVPPGSYVLVAQPVDGLMGVPAPHAVDVGPAGAGDIVLAYDTGIR